MTSKLESASVDMAKEAGFERELRDIVLAATAKVTCEVFLFGSRARGAATRASDFDIGIRGLSARLFAKVKSDIEDAVEESHIPHEVDILDFETASEAFRSVACKDRVVWKDA